MWAPFMLLQVMLVAGALCSAAVSCTSMQSKDLELDLEDRVGRGLVTHFWSSPLRGMAALSVSSSSLQHQAMKYTPAATYARNTLRLPVLVSCSGRCISCERGVMRINEGAGVRPQATWEPGACVQVCAPCLCTSQQVAPATQVLVGALKAHMTVLPEDPSCVRVQIPA